AYALYKVADYCYDVNYVFKDLMWGWLDLCDWLDHLWDELGDLWDDLDTLWDYVYTTLKGLVNDAVAIATNALNQVIVAYDMAVDAWNYATGWLTDRANEAYNKAVWAYEQIASAVTASAQEIYAWVIGIPTEIRSFIDGVVADIKAWVETYTPIAITAALAAIAAPINLINLWFDDIQNFFNDPLGWLWNKIWSYLERYW
ncbi:unnamed protein product, partial [marine sediment metagenome]